MSTRTNLRKTFGRGKIHAANGTGAEPLCMPYGGNGSHGIWSATVEAVTCAKCLAQTAPAQEQCSDPQCVLIPGHYPAQYHRNDAGAEWGNLSKGIRS